jgi:acetyltransferase-like isoleucine patch superfamily enzyme
MLRWSRHFSRSILTKVRLALRENSPRNRWLDEARRFSRVHESIEFKGCEPDAALISIGADCCIERDVTIWLSSDEGAQPRLAMGNSVYIGRNSFLGCYQPITMGDNVMIGAFVYFTSGDHRFDRRDIPMHLQGFEGGAIQLGSDVWIGTHVTILPGLEIGNGAIIGAGSVVTRSVPAYEIWAGVPARFLKHRPG